MSNVSPLQGPDGRTLGLGVIEDLAAHHLSVSPANYELWLSYRTGATAGLTREIDQAIAGASLNQRLIDTLYEKHFASSRFSVQMLETGDGIARELADVLNCLRAAGDQTRSYGDTLNAAQNLDANEADPALFRARVRALLSATREMTEHHQKMSAQIEQSTQQVESLQAALSSVKAEALSDALTGLGNRRLFEATMSKRIQECNDAGLPLSLVICDIDHFKRVNDTWGHVVGDQVIRYVGHVLKQTAPKGALVARYGGEEFALILPRLDCLSAAEIAEQARQRIRAQRITKRSTGQVIGAVTVSFGVAELKAGDNFTTILERADKRLYAAKGAGRDQVVSAERVHAAA